MESANENKQQPKAQVENYANEPLDQKKGQPGRNIKERENEKEKEGERERDKGNAMGSLKQAAKDGDIKVLDWESIVHFIAEPFRRK